VSCFLRKPACMLLRRELTSACLYSVLVIRRVHNFYSVFARPIGLYEATSVTGPFSL